MLWLLLRKNISAVQLVAYLLASLAGMTIILCAVRFYSDVSGAYEGEDSFMSRDYLVLSKRVAGLNALGLGGSTDFSEREISDLARRPWVRDVGAFTSASFNVRASVDMGDRSMSSFLFLESVPDSFLDVSPADWTWTPGDGTVPVIISKDYLTLYNFGFAATQGLPQLSEGLVSSVPLTLTLAGNGREVSFKARIVGFSSRLNTIAVPQQFMDRANSTLGSGTRAPSRLIVEVNTPGDPAIERFLKQNNYEVAGDKMDNGRANYFLTLVTGIIIAVGAVITVLALVILVLSILLLLQRNRETLRNLILLGYTARAVGRPYRLLILTVNLLTLILSLGITALAASWWQPRMQALGMAAGPATATVLTALAMTAVITAFSLAVLTVCLRRLQ